jgi:hypothetical protein
VSGGEEYIVPLGNYKAATSYIFLSLSLDWIRGAWSELGLEGIGRGIEVAAVTKPAGLGLIATHTATDY